MVQNKRYQSVSPTLHKKKFWFVPLSFDIKKIHELVVVFENELILFLIRRAIRTIIRTRSCLGFSTPLTENSKKNNKLKYMLKVTEFQKFLYTFKYSKKNKCVLFTLSFIKTKILF